MSLFNIEVKDHQGNITTLEEYKGQVILIVNTASKCGYTPQFAGLEALYKEYQNDGFVVLGFPCNQFLHQEPGDMDEILDYCQTNYGVDFPIFAKLNVKGKEQAELYNYLVENSPVRTGKKVKWNFEKFLINRNGEIVNRYKPKVKPEELKSDIENLL